MKYKSFKIDEEKETKAKSLNLTVNEYVGHLIRLNEEFKSDKTEQTYEKMEAVEIKVQDLDIKLTKISEQLDLLARLSKRLVT